MIIVFMFFCISLIAFYMLRLSPAPSVMDSAALFLLYLITKLQNLKAIHNLFLAWSPDHEYIVAHGIAQPCGGNKVRVSFEYLDGPNRKVC